MCITVILLYSTDRHKIVHKSEILHLKKGGGYNSENWIQKEWLEEQRGRCYYTESAHHLFQVMLLEFANSWAETCPPARVSVRVE